MTNNVENSTIIRYCAQCGQEPLDGRRLKRCRGCFAGPIYCNEACQRAHWPVHKLVFHGLGMTRDSAFYRIHIENDVLRCGYASVDAFSRAVADFVEAHKWAFATTALANRVTRFGTTMDEYPSDLFLQYRLFTRGRPSQNPANGFRWDNVRWKHLPEWLAEVSLPWMLDEVSQALEKARRAADRHFSSDPLYIGAMPVVFTINDLSLIFWRIIPQYAPRGVPPPTDSNQVACEDTGYLCTKAVNNRVVLRCPGSPDACAGLALPGRFVRAEGKWTWEGFEGGWGLLHGSVGVAPHPSVAEILKEDYKSGLEPDGMMRALTVYRDGIQLGMCVDQGEGKSGIFV